MRLSLLTVCTAFVASDAFSWVLLGRTETRLRGVCGRCFVQYNIDRAARQLLSLAAS